MSNKLKILPILLIGAYPSLAKSEPAKPCLDPDTGQHLRLVAEFKNTLREPDSFEHIKTIVFVGSDGAYRLLMRYRARNGFGGMNVSLLGANLDPATCDYEIVTNVQS
ncbi:MAG: hypothetical protein PHE36_04535 [Novosphingobium sp.]|nr:hypothetical protein [Novosphingobium sp.]